MITNFKKFMNEQYNNDECFVPQYNIDDIVKIADDNDNENYNKYRDMALRIINVATNKTEHPGYDYSMNGQGLYDLRVVDTNEDVPFSLYDYELEPYE